MVAHLTPYLGQVRNQGHKLTVTGRKMFLSWPRTQSTYWRTESGVLNVFIHWCTSTEVSMDSSPSLRRRHFLADVSCSYASLSDSRDILLVVWRHMVSLATVLVARQPANSTSQWTRPRPKQYMCRSKHCYVPVIQFTLNLSQWSSCSMKMTAASDITGLCSTLASSVYHDNQYNIQP